MIVQAIRSALFYALFLGQTVVLAFFVGLWALTVPRGEKRLRELFERWLTWESQTLPGGCIFVTGSVEFDDQPGPMRDALVADQRDWLDTIATVVETAVTEGDFRSDLDARQVAFELQALTLGFHHFARLLGDEHATDHARTAFEGILERARFAQHMGEREQGLEMIGTARCHLEGQLTRRLEVALFVEPFRPPRHRVELHGGDGGRRAGARGGFASLRHVLYSRQIPQRLRPARRRPTLSQASRVRRA